MSFSKQANNSGTCITWILWSVTVFVKCFSEFMHIGSFYALKNREKKKEKFLYVH